MLRLGLTLFGRASSSRREDIDPDAFFRGRPWRLLAGGGVTLKVTASQLLIPLLPLPSLGPRAEESKLTTF